LSLRWYYPKRNEAKSSRAPWPVEITVALRYPILFAPSR
jgi:hypothetical protein